MFGRTLDGGDGAVLCCLSAGMRRLGELLPVAARDDVVATSLIHDGHIQNPDTFHLVYLYRAKPFLALGLLSFSLFPSLSLSLSRFLALARSLSLSDSLHPTTRFGPLRSDRHVLDLAQANLRSELLCPGTTLSTCTRTTSAWWPSRMRVGS